LVAAMPHYAIGTNMLVVFGTSYKYMN